MRREIDFFFSFRSPYSYLAIDPVEALVTAYDLHITIRIVRPLALRVPGFFKRLNSLGHPYLLRDTARIAERHGIPFAWPTPDPVAMDMATGEVDPDQPLIHMLNRRAVAAERAGRGFSFVAVVSRLIWSGVVECWDEGDHLAAAATGVGLDLLELDRAIGRGSSDFDAIVEANEAAQAAAGHWGVPLFLFEGEPFFGQDRIDDLVWWLERSGLTRRA